MPKTIPNDFILDVMKKKQAPSVTKTNSQYFRLPKTKPHPRPDFRAPSELPIGDSVPAQLQNRARMSSPGCRTDSWRHRQHRPLHGTPLRSPSSGRRSRVSDARHGEDSCFPVTKEHMVDLNFFYSSKQLHRQGAAAATLSRERDEVGRDCSLAVGEIRMREKWFPENIQVAASFFYFFYWKSSRSFHSRIKYIKIGSKSK